MILLDYKDRRPLYEQVADKLENLMVCDILEQDSQLPSVRSLATELSINPNTIQRAYAELERCGFIYSVKGKGSFVSDRGSIRALKAAKLRKGLGIWIGEARKAGVTKIEAGGWLEAGWNERKFEKGEEDKSDSSEKPDEAIR